MIIMSLKNTYLFTFWAVLSLKLHHTGSFVTMCKLSSCDAGSVAPRHVKILVPQAGIKPASAALEDRFLTNWTTREVSIITFNLNFKM